ncbi:MAG: lipopolysaccharide heptosyltransferase family protein [Desulfobacteraceae bacterium]|nr:MAG: lipopolysaccharide heptosyltransferase family protein [Desulfobacteraceae bacterium]
MKVLFQRSIDRAVGILLCRLLSFFPWRYKKVPSGFTPRKILVVCLSEMGSLVLTKPMFDNIHQRFPDAGVHVLLFERNRSVLEILDLVPDARVQTIDDRSFMRFLVSSMRLVFELRRKEIDTVIDCELFSRISSLLSLLSGAKVRVGFHAHTQEGLFRGDFINRPVPYNPYRHISLQFLTMVQSIGLTGAPLVKSGERLELPEIPQTAFRLEEKNRFLHRLESDFPQLMRERFVLLYPGGGLLPVRAWPLAHYCRTSEELIAKGYAVGVIGMREDKPLAEKIRLSCKSEKCLDLTGYTKDLKELLCLMEGASLLISNDGGPGHFSSLVPTPAIILYGPETPVLYGILKKNACLFHLPLPCSPCLTAYNHRKSPCDGNNLCLKLISPETVLEKAYRLMAEDQRNAGEHSSVATQRGSSIDEPPRHRARSLAFEGA